MRATVDLRVRIERRPMKSRLEFLNLTARARSLAESVSVG